MQIATSIFQNYMDVVFLIYGFSFVAMGLIIVTHNHQESDLDLATNLWLLASFGFIHGFLEWMDLWHIVRGNTPWPNMTQPLILFISFLLLFEFGRRMLDSALPDNNRPRPVSTLLNIWIYAPILFVIISFTVISDKPELTLNILSRYLLGFIGASLAGGGFFYYYQRLMLILVIPDTESRQIRLASYVASATCVAYGILSGLIVPTAAWLPASFINQENFLLIFNIPVQLLRACCALLLTIAIAILIKVFVIEAKQRLTYALQGTQKILTELRMMHRYNELILASTSEGIFGMDHEGITIFVNAAALKMLGYTREELMGKPIHDIIHHTMKNGTSYLLDNCPIHQTAKMHTVHRVNNDIFWRKDASSFSVEYQSAPLRDNTRIIGVVVAFNYSPTLSTFLPSLLERATE